MTTQQEAERGLDHLLLPGPVEKNHLHEPENLPKVRTALINSCDLDVYHNAQCTIALNHWIYSFVERGHTPLLPEFFTLINNMTAFWSKYFHGNEKLKVLVKQALVHVE